MKFFGVKKRAISPVIASVLLIGLVVMASALIYFIAIPMLTGNPTLIQESVTLQDTVGNKYVDKISLGLRNIGDASADIEKVEVLQNSELTDWHASSVPITVGVGIARIVEVSPLNIDTFRIRHGDTVQVKVYYNDLILITNLVIPAQYTPIIIFYSEDFESYNIGDTPTGWTYFHIADHSPAGTRSISDWTVQYFNDDKVLKYGRNNCQFIILDDPEYVFTDVNITFTLHANNDDDIMGIIFRFQEDYNDTGEPGYYLVAYTNDHTLTDSRNGPHYNGIMEGRRLTLFFVEGQGYPGHPDNPVASGDKGTLYTLHSVLWNWETSTSNGRRDDNKWYTYTVAVVGSTIEVYIDGILRLSTVDDRLTSGKIGIMSGAIEGAMFGFIEVWGEA